MSTENTDTPQEPPASGWLPKDGRKVGPVPQASEEESPDGTQSKGGGFAELFRVHGAKEAAKPAAKLFMFITGVASLAAGVTLIALARPSELKGLYVMGSMSTILAICSLGACLYFTVRDMLVSRAKRDANLAEVQMARRLSEGPVTPGAPVPGPDHLYTSVGHTDQQATSPPQELKVTFASTVVTPPVASKPTTPSAVQMESNAPPLTGSETVE